MKTIEVNLNKEELYIIYSALNEICNITDIPDFELRIGYSEEAVEELLNKISEFYDSLKLQNRSEATIEINPKCDELYLINVSLTEICHILEIPEFELRIGYPEDNALQVFKKINNLYKSRQ